MSGGYLSGGYLSGGICPRIKKGTLHVCSITAVLWKEDSNNFIASQWILAFGNRRMNCLLSKNLLC